MRVRCACVFFQLLLGSQLGNHIEGGVLIFCCSHDVILIGEELPKVKSLHVKQWNALWITVKQGPNGYRKLCVDVLPSSQ